MKKLVLLASLCAAVLGLVSLLGCANDMVLTEEDYKRNEKDVTIPSWGVTSFSEDVSKKVADGKMLHFKVQNTGGWGGFWITTDWWTEDTGKFYFDKECTDSATSTKYARWDKFSEKAGSDGWVDIYYLIKGEDEVKKALDTGKAFLSVIANCGTVVIDASTVELLDAPAPAQ